MMNSQGEDNVTRVAIYGEKLLQGLAVNLRGKDMRTREHIFGEDMMKLTGILLVIAAAMAWIDAFFGRRRIRPRGDLLDTADLGRKFVFIGPGGAIDGLSKSLAGGRAVDGKNGGKSDFDPNGLKSKI